MAKRELIQEYKHGFEADAQGLFEMLSEQFKDPLLCFRELVQNSIDENPTEIHLNSQYDSSKEILKFSIEDNGNGMNLEGIQTYLTIFDSTKEGLEDKIGEFGIGKLSTFVLEPEGVIVETGKNNEGYQLILDSKGKGKLYRTNPKKGTKIILTKKIPSCDVENLLGDIENSIIKNCSFTKTPLFMNGERINKEFNINSRYKKKVKMENLEAIIGLSNDSIKQYFKGGILLEDVKPTQLDIRYDEVDRHLCLLVDSFDFDQTLSRNRIIKNEKFHEILNFIDKETGKFNLQLARSYMKDNISNGEAHLLREHFMDYLWKEKNLKKIKKTFKKLNIFSTLNVNNISLNDLQESYDKENRIYHTSTWRFSDDLKYFTKNNIPILFIRGDEEDKKVQNFLKYNFQHFEDLDKTVLVKKIPQEEITETYEKYLESINSIFKDKILSRIEIPDIVGRYKKNLPSYDAFSGVDLGYFCSSKGFEERRQMFQVDKGIVSLNLYNEFVESMVRLTEKDPALSTFYTISELFNNDQLFPHIPLHIREGDILKLSNSFIKKYLKNSKC